MQNLYILPFAVVPPRQMDCGCDDRSQSNVYKKCISKLRKAMMPRTDFLKPLNDLAYCCECAAQDYTGELKSELSELCQLIRVDILPRLKAGDSYGAIR